MGRLAAMLMVVIAGGFGGDVVGQVGAKAGAGVVEPRKTTVGTAIIILNREAKSSWVKDKKWPRDSMDFATEKNWAVPSADIARALGRQLNKNPAIDGYIKWQLLSFEPELVDLSDQVFNQLVARTPEPLNQPLPEIREKRGSSGGRVFAVFGTQTSYISDLDPVVANGAVAYNPRVSTITNGVILDAEGAASPALSAFSEVRRANYQLAAAKDMVAEANRAIVAYRDALIEQLQVNGATRLGLIFKDVKSRIQAGEKTYSQSMTHLANETARLADDESITPRIRGVLMKWGQELAAMETKVVDSVDITSRGELIYDYYNLSINQEEINGVLENLLP